MEVEIIELKITDYEEVITLWENSQGVRLRDADSRENIERYLHRNPGLSYIACHNGKIVGAVLCGHDGRRGYLNHLAVLPDYRRQGIATKLVQSCLSQLQKQGIDKCHLFILSENDAASSFWSKQGWRQRSDIIMMSLSSSKSLNA
ncbi:N-acetyltransferase [Rivularia sp. IAM M-261]|nr:N-acetyltransferase [Calothrix sp. PCC 7716]GJD23848.1 N-acetyltransferase [Rivularia sp. IAM M-261]